MAEQELVDVEEVKSTGRVLLQHSEAWMLHQNFLLAHFHTLLAVSKIQAGSTLITTSVHYCISYSQEFVHIYKV